MQDERLIRVARKKDEILGLLRQKGLRVTRQRKLILDIVFAHECTCCKEIYYQAAKKDKGIGIATVYRMVNVLTDLGVFQVQVPYRVAGELVEGSTKGCQVILKGQETVELSREEWEGALIEILERKGYGKETEIERVEFL